MAPTSFRVIDAEETHLPGILAIYNHAVRESFAIWSETEVTLEQRRQWRAGRLAAGFPVLVAVAKDGAVLGYGSYGAFRDFPGYALTVEHSVYVATDAQRRGVGKALLEALIARARAQHMQAMVGGIDSQNQPSIALHAALGFERQGLLKGVGRKFGKSLDLLFMVKAL